MKPPRSVIILFWFWFTVNIGMMLWLIIGSVR